MQNTSKPGGRTPIIKAVWVCAADKVRVSVSRWHTPTQRFTEYPPPHPDEGQISKDRCRRTDTSDVLLGSDSSHDVIG